MILLLACTAPDKNLPTITPDHSDLTAQVEAVLTLPGRDVAEIAGVRIGDRAAPILAAEGEVLTVLLQGAAATGEAAVVVTAGGAEEDVGIFMRYEGEPAPGFERMWVVGASLGEGVQSGMPSLRGALHSPPLLLARAAGADLPQPLLREGTFRQMEVADIGPAPGCEIPDIGDFLTVSAAERLAQLGGPEGLELWRARLDPDIRAQNLSAAGTRVEEFLDGSGEFGEQLIAHLVSAPRGQPTDPMPSQAEALAALPPGEAPTIVINFDILGNDLIDIAMNDPLDTAHMTPAADLAAAMDGFAASLAALGVPVYVANAPSPLGLPTPRRIAAEMQAEGWTAEEIAAIQAEAEARVVEANALLAAAFAPWPQLHVVDVYGEVRRLTAEGLAVGAGADQRVLTTRLGGGLLSLDGLHFSDTGYARLAGLFVAAINEGEGLALPEPDLAAALATDPWSPDRLADLAGCVY